MSGKPDLVYLCHRMPWPPIKGEKIHTWRVLNHLAKRYHVHLGCLVDEAGDMDHVARMQGVCASVGAFRVTRQVQLLRALVRARPGRPLQPDTCWSPGLSKWLNETIRRVQPLVIVISSVAMAPYAIARRGIRLVLDAQDIDSEKWATYAGESGFPMRHVWAREGRTLLAYERRAAAACDVTFFVSEPEAARFAELAPESANKITWFENGVDLAYFDPAHVFASPFAAGEPALVFTGHMQYRPNVDAVAWFVAEALPLLRAKIADMQFWIVGADPSASVRALAEVPGVHVTGRVPDTRPYLAHAGVVVCPLRIARGIQNKVLEAMAMGRPVVASPGAFEGVRAVAGRDLLVAEDAVSFCAAVFAVLNGEHTELGKRARQAMAAHYDWEATLSRLDAYV